MSTYPIKAALTTETLPYIALGCAIPAYISKSKTAYLNYLPNIAHLTSFPKPLSSFGIGLQIYSIVDLTGQIRKATTKTDRFILVCTVFVAAETAYSYFKELVLEKEKTPNTSPPTQNLYTRIFIVLTKTVALSVQTFFHPLMTVACVVAGFALEFFDVLAYIVSFVEAAIQKEEDLHKKSDLQKNLDSFKRLLPAPLETGKTIVIWNEWRKVASSVPTGNGAFKAGLEQGIDLARLFGKTPPPSPKETKT